jgi:hypothetical protein
MLTMGQHDIAGARSMIHDRIKQLMLTICLATSAPDCFAAADDAPEAALPVMAIWHTQQVGLSFHSGNIHYSCEGLRTKIVAVLRAVGAREGVNVDLPCLRNALTNQIVTHVTVTSPLEATEQNLEAATKYSTEAQLVARLNKVDLPTANDLHRFPAERRTVVLGGQGRLKLDGADCDLLAALSQQIFPLLDIQVPRGRMNCPINGASRIRPKIQVKALMPVGAESVAHVGVGGRK